MVNTDEEGFRHLCSGAVHLRCACGEKGHLSFILDLKVSILEKTLESECEIGPLVMGRFDPISEHP